MNFRLAIRLPLTLSLLFVVACSDDAPVESEPTDDVGGTIDLGDDAEEDAAVGDATSDGADASEDTADAPDPYVGRYGAARDLEVDEALTVEGLRYPVHIVRDDLGIPHILAESGEDAFYAQGYMHAVDRFPQMEIFRRATSGRLAVVAGGLDESIVDDDIFIRQMGFNRMGRAIYEALPEDSLERRAVDAYAAGVNQFIRELRARDRVLPSDYSLLLALWVDWEPWDGLSIIRFQQYDLGFDGHAELSRTRVRGIAEGVFSADSEDPDLAARAGIHSDLRRLAPADPTYQVPGFTGPSEKSSRAAVVDQRPWRAPTDWALDSAIEVASGFPHSRWFPSVADPRGMSNSWAVSPNLTANGNALLANDPHLGLNSPTVFHQAHIVVEPRTPEDGPAMNVYGIIFPGLPGVLIGHNEHVAWGLTTASYDYVDAFVEELVWEDGEDWPKLRSGDGLVELEIIEEQLEIGSLGRIDETVTIQIPWVPGRGPLWVDYDGTDVDLPRDTPEAISFAWRGFEASNEIGAVMRWMTAEDVDDIQESLPFWTIGTQNLLFATTDGDIYTTGSSYIPGRPEAALTYHPVDNPDGYAPWFTLRGTGEHDWLDEPLDASLIPWALNPDEGFIVTANNDQAGVTDDDDPLNDYAYVGYEYSVGFRAGRIRRMLTNDAELWDDGHALTLEDMSRMQLDHYSDLGERVTPFLVAAAARALEEYETPGTHSDLVDVVAANAGLRARVQLFHDRLDGWSFWAEDGLWGNPSDDQITAATDTAMFNFWLAKVIRGAFSDEQAAAPGFSIGSDSATRALLWLLEHPADTATYDQTSGQSIVWDDLSTGDALESRDAILVAALFAADDELTTTFESASPGDWVWGELHVRTFDHEIPDISDVGGSLSPYDWPQPDEDWPDGYPMLGDNYNVSACNGGVWGFNFDCGGGATLRFAVELDPDGIRSVNALPGGQVQDKRSPFFRNLLDEYWLQGRTYEVPFHPDDVVDANEIHMLLTSE